MDKKRKPGSGGARVDAGRKSAAALNIEKRQQYPLTVLPSIMAAFRAKYGRGASRRIEELILQDILTDN
ncbi:hypothetical protein DCC81_11845 [Chitinophaga parva]|uniref:Uncharacterized protein n=1 Tax=Chitinophaga parva TaxID=2169414 RepID=A0A2T7BFE3_9BACT|nr:hypothetical protein DCC81_11845 [Chitinophaga parva]